MGSPQRTRSSTKWEVDEDADVDIDIVRNDSDRDDDDDKRKQRSSKSRKAGSGEDAGSLDGSCRKRSASDRHESRKRVSGSSRADSDEDDYEARKELRSKQARKKSENTLDVLSTWYQDGEAENRLEGGDKSASRGYSRAEESERKKSTSKYLEHDIDVEKHVRSSRRRWDEADNVSKPVDYGEKSDVRSGKLSDCKLDTASERERIDTLERDSMNEKGIKSHERQERRVDSDRSKRGRSEFLEEDKGSLTLEDRSGNERFEENRQQRNPARDTSRTPEKVGRRQFEPDNFETDYERSNSFRRKELGKDGSMDDRLKVRDDSWGDRNRDKDNMRDWELQRRGRDRIDGRLGGRKDGNRTEAVKTSSKYGISNENYDVIEIQTKSLDYAREYSRRNDDAIQQPDTKLAPDFDVSVVQSGEDTKDRSMDGAPAMQNQHSWRDEYNGSQSSSGGSLPPRGNPQGMRGNRIGARVGRGSRPPLVSSPFGPIGLAPPGPIQSLPPNMSPSPVPPIFPGVFIPPFQPPLIWPGPRGVDMNMLGVPPGLPPVPPGPLGPRFPPNGGLIFNQSGPMIRGQSQDKASGGWVPPRISGPTGKAPSRGEQNDYSQNFVDTGMRPQNFIRELELTSVVEDYPKLRELIQKKDEIVANSASSPMYCKCDLREQVLSPEVFGTKFDVILVDPPWEEYVHRAPGVTDHMDYWTLEEIMNLKIEAIADTPSFIFLWVGDGVGLEQGRQCLKKWGFRRCEDICWVKTNKTNAAPGLRHDSHTLFQRSKEHCLMGIKGTVRRSTDGHIIHANIDTDVIIAEEPPYGSTAKPEDMYRIIEHFALGRRRLELFGGDHNIRSGWLTVGNELSSSNFDSGAYTRNFADNDGKVWLGGGGRNPPPEAPHLILTTPDIESLRPKSPMKNQQQLQQQSVVTISLTTSNSSNKRPTGNSPQNHNANNLNLEASSSNMTSPAPWMENFKGRENGNMMFGVYGYNGPFGPPGSGEFSDYESQRGMNML